MLQETIAYLSYSGSDLQAAYWRTASGFEVDIIVFDPYSHGVKCSIEVKSCEVVQNRHLKGLMLFVKSIRSVVPSVSRMTNPHA